VGERTTVLARRARGDYDPLAAFRPDVFS